MAGRVMARRFMGKLAFMSLVDDSGSIQIYLDKAVLDAAEADTFKYISCCLSFTLRPSLDSTFVINCYLGLSSAVLFAGLH